MFHNVKKLFFALPFSLLAISTVIHTASPFDPMPGDREWDLMVEVGMMANAVEGTQNRIQQTDFGTSGYTISLPGRYALVENISYSPSSNTPAIRITSSDVVLDLNGFTISYDGTPTADIIAIDSGTSNIAIFDGILENNTNASLGLTCTGSSEININNLKCYGTSSGMTFTVCDKVIMRDLFIDDVSTTGLQFVTCSEINCSRCTISQTAQAISIEDSNSICIRDVSCASNTDADITLDQSHDILLQNISSFNALNNSIELQGSLFNIVIRGCTISNPANDAVTISGSSINDIIMQEFHIKDANNGFNIISTGINALSLHDISINNSAGSAFTCGTNAQNVSLTNIAINSTASTSVTFSDDCTNCQCINMAINTSAAQGMSFGDRAQNLYLQNITLNAIDQEGIAFGTDAQSIVINNSCLADIGQTSFGFSAIKCNDNTSDIFIQNTDVINCGDSGYEFTSNNTQIRLFNCTAQNVGSFAGFAFGATSNVQCINCTTQQASAGRGFNLDQASCIVLKGCTAQSCAEFGFDINHMNNCIISDCVGMDNGTTDIQIRNSTSEEQYRSGLVINQCYCADTGTNGIQATDGQISFLAPVICNNAISGHQTGIKLTAAYAILANNRVVQQSNAGIELADLTTPTACTALNSTQRSSFNTLYNNFINFCDTGFLESSSIANPQPHAYVSNCASDNSTANYSTLTSAPNVLVWLTSGSSNNPDTRWENIQATTI